MQFTDFKNENANDERFAYDTITMLMPGDDDDDEDEDGDWSDIDDEDFEDMAEDMNDLHEIQVDDDLGEPDPEDDDHLPDDDF